MIHHESIQARSAIEGTGVGSFDVVEYYGEFKVIQSDGGMTLSEHSSLRRATRAAQAEADRFDLDSTFVLTFVPNVVSINLLGDHSSLYSIEWKVDRSQPIEAGKPVRLIALLTDDQRRSFDSYGDWITLEPLRN